MTRKGAGKFVTETYKLLTKIYRDLSWKFLVIQTF